MAEMLASLSLLALDPSAAETADLVDGCVDAAVRSIPHAVVDPAQGGQVNDLKIPDLQEPIQL